MVAAAMVASLGWAQEAWATPIYAIRAAQACDTCHIEPIGWLDPPEIEERHCSLDCKACHVSATGGGLRNAAGRFYARETLPTFGSARPSASANPEKYRNATTRATEGRFRLWDGFSGWDRGGETPVDSISDRYGDIEASPLWSWGLDARAMGFFPDDDDAKVFPMQLEFYLAAQPNENITLYSSAGLQGRRDRTFNDPGEDIDSVTDYFTVRELFAEYDRMPWNGYVRAGRFTKPYGWRIPDHTSFVRAGLQQTQFAQVFGVEAGINPNYPFANVAAFYQGWDAWLGDRTDTGAGVSLTMGIRELGWQLGTSFEYLHLTDRSVDRITGGPMWAVNLYPVVLLGEFDVRGETGGPNGTRVGLYAYQEVNWLVWRGVTALLKYDWADADVGFADGNSQRVTLGAQWDIISGLQLATQYRLNFEQDALDNQELLIWVHAFY